MESNHKENIKEIFDKSERIAVIGSPSKNTEISIDILGTAVEKRLVGNLCAFSYVQEGKDHYAMGQIVEVGMRNVWAEDPTMRSLIRQRGSVEPVTEKQDYHYGKMAISSVFSVASDTGPSMLGTIPSTGTSIRLMGEELMASLLGKLPGDITYLGRAYGTDIKLPMWFKHFGNGPGGAGEAYHIGVFGKTGSGKSVLSKMLVLGYAKNRPLSIFILDPQGEFTKMKKQDQLLSMVDKKFHKEIKFIGLHNLILTGRDLFKKILIASPFLEKLQIYHSDNRSRAADEILETLRGKKKDKLNAPREEIKPWDYYKRESFDAVWDILQLDDTPRKIYTSQEPQDRLRSAIRTSDVNEMYELWASICRLFAYENNTKKYKITDLVNEITGTDNGKIVVVDLSEGDIPKDLFWNEKIRKTVIEQLLSAIINSAENAYREDKLLNALIVMDEAHRLVPRDVDKDDETSLSLKSRIIDGIRTTRKYGLGWMFISQTLSGIDKEIINQIRAYIFGYGLAYGIERQALKEIISGSEDSFRLYQLFRDPQSGFGKPEYSYMSFGPISPLSFSGTPLFFTSLDFPKEFMDVNFTEGGNSDNSN